MRAWTLATATVIALLPQPVAGQRADVLTAAQARAEVQMVYDTIMQRHPEPFWYTDQATWQAELDRLTARQGPITHVQQYFDLAHLMSLAVDTHVQVYPGEDTPGFERSYPLRFRLFEEGIHVIAADDPYRDWVGSRVVSIAGTPAREVVATLTRYAFSDHPIRQASWGVTYLLPHPAVYRYLGWAGADGSVAIELEGRDGRRTTTRLSATIAASHHEVHRSGTVWGYKWPAGWRTLDDLMTVEVPMSRAHLDRHYWYTDLEDGQVVYFQFNNPSDQPGGTRALPYLAQMFTDLATRSPRPRRIIVDARYNLGGWVPLTRMIGNLLHASGFCCASGGVVVLSGPEAVSAGGVLVGSAERTVGAIVIGEPSGSPANLHLGQSPITLPYSGFRPEIPSYLSVNTDSRDTRMFVAPDIAVPESFVATLAGRDRALEAALALTTEEADVFRPDLTTLEPWFRPSQQRAQRPVPPGSR